MPGQLEVSDLAMKVRIEEDISLDNGIWERTVRVRCQNTYSVQVPMYDSF